MFSVAIDGPSGAGKSTLSQRIARELGFVYVDTGAMYRAVGLAALRGGADPKDRAAVAALLPDVKLDIKYIDGEQRIFLGDEDVSEAIRAEDVSMAASDVSAHVPVRAFLLETQRRMARENNVIMDGRDIGTVVLPDADLKIFLSADVDDRARRRYDQLKLKGVEADYEKIRADVIQRDYNDSNRAAAPLKKAEDAVAVDTTGNEFDQSFEILLNLVKQRMGGAAE